MTSGRLEGLGRDALHVVALWSLAVAQPLYSVLGKGPEFFVARRAGPGEVLLFVLLVTAALPALLGLLEAGAGLLGRRVRQGVHALLLAVLFGTLALQAIRDVEALPGDMLVLDAAVAGAALAALYFRWRPARLLLTYLAPAPLVFAGVFLFGTPVSRVVFPREPAQAERPAITRPAPIVLVVFDELNSTFLMDESRRIDPIRYPNLARLTREATWYRAATTVSGNTTRAVPAILTGVRPRPTPVAARAREAHHGNLFTLLDGTYRMVAVEPITRLCPDRLCEEAANANRASGDLPSLLSDVAILTLHVLLPPDLAARLPAVTQAWGDFAAGPPVGPVAMFDCFLSAIAPTDGPGLFFAHIVFPHVPWRYLPSGRRYEDASGGWQMDGWVRHGDHWLDDEWAVVQGFQRHLLQLGALDRLVGALVARLEAVGLYDETLLVLASDHGLSFQPGRPRRRVTPATLGDVLPVLLLVKLPGQRSGGVSDRNVETVDILPTIAEAIGTTVPWPVDGTSVLDPSRPERPYRVVAGPHDEPVTVSPALPGRWRSLHRMLALFGSGARPDGLYRIGPFGGLVGRPVEALEPRPPDGRLVLSLDQPRAWDAVDPAASVLPVRVTGRVRSAAPQNGPVHLAVAVNGTVRATTRTSPSQEGGAGFSAIVPEAALRPGRNEVEVLLVEGSPDSPVLRRLAAGEG